jgi:hypothetical protein
MMSKDKLFTLDEMLGRMKESYHPHARATGAGADKDNDVVYSEIVKEVINWDEYIKGRFDRDHFHGFKCLIHHVSYLVQAYHSTSVDSMRYVRASISV